MGSSNWSDDHYQARSAFRAQTNTPVFQYSAQIDSGQVAAACHKDLDPKGVIRESRDSAAHPESNAVMVWFDVTGSMGGIPVTLQTKLPKLLGLLLRRGYLTDPQICFGAVGDARCDMAPLQVGQYESGIEMEDSLSKIYLEGNGGGNHGESYELAMFMAARKTSIDCFEKRGKKGYFFLIGDEELREEVNRNELKAVIGDNIERLTTEDLVKELQEKYETFILIPTKSFNQTIKSTWTKYFGERVIEVKDPNEIAESIAALIGINEGFDVGDVIKDTGASNSLSKELTAFNGKALRTNVSGGLTTSSVAGIL